MINMLFIAACAVTLQGCLAWYLASRYRRASIADIFWPLHHLLVGFIWLLTAESLGLGNLLAFALLALWATRLATHLCIRQVGAPEDRRYAAVRENAGAGFDGRSLYVIFVPQALMAWFMSLALLPTLTQPDWSWLAYTGITLGLVGLIWEVVADLQLTAFIKQTHSNSVMDSGLWALCRHPNYFGEWLFWLGICVTAFSLMDAFAAAAFLPMVLLSYLLMRFTGVLRTETGMHARRPGYATYQQQTPAFFPRMPRRSVLRAPESQMLFDAIRAGSRVLGQRFGRWSVLLGLMLAGSVSLPETAIAQNAKQQSWFFDVHIDGQQVGFHEFVATQAPWGYDVTAKAQFRYKLMGVTLFSYDHEVREQYDADMCLVSIESKTKTNRKVQHLKGTASDGGYALQTDINTRIDQSCLMTFAYWSPKLLTQQQLLNGQTGQIVDVSIGPTQTAAATEEPNLYNLKGEKLDITLGFSASGQWRSLNSLLPNGRELTYHLRNQS